MRKLEVPRLMYLGVADQRRLYVGAAAILASAWRMAHPTKRRRLALPRRIK